MKRLLSSVLAIAVAIAALPDGVFAAEPAVAAPQPLRESIARAVEAVPLAQSAQPAAPRPRSGPDTSRKQMSGGGGKTGMILGIVGSLAGAATAVYMIREMRKATEEARQ